MVEVTIAINKLNSQHADFNATLAGLCEQAVISGATNEYLGNGEVKYLISVENFPMTLGQAIVSFGCTVYKMPFFIKVASESTNVPAGIPNRLDGDGNVLTWVNWKRSNFDFHTGTDSNIYLAAEANTGDVVELNDFMSESANLIDSMTFTSLMPTD